MADRNIREPTKALAQRLGRLEERTRAMALRTWSGAIRTAAEDAATLDDDPAQLSAVVSVTVIAGRWVVFAQAKAVIEAPNPWAAPRIQVVVVDPAGDELPAVDCDLPDYRNVVNTTCTYEAIMSCFRSLTANEQATVTMLMCNDGGDAMTVEDARLLLDAGVRQMPQQTSLWEDRRR